MLTDSNRTSQRVRLGALPFKLAHGYNGGGRGSRTPAPAQHRPLSFQDWSLRPLEYSSTLTAWLPTKSWLHTSPLYSYNKFKFSGTIGCAPIWCAGWDLNSHVLSNNRVWACRGCHYATRAYYDPRVANSQIITLCTKLEVVYTPRCPWWESNSLLPLRAYSTPFLTTILEHIAY